jgi:hypothetical protein
MTLRHFPFRSSLSVALRLAALLSLPPWARAADDEFYAQLAKSEVLRVGFEAKRTETGVDFESKEQIQLNGQAHPRFHFEVEGPLPVPNVKTLNQAVQLIASFITPEIDAAHEEKDSVQPGLGATIVDVNGTKVAFLQYKNSKQPDTYCRRALIFNDGRLFSAEMSLHSVPENDRKGILLPALMIELVRLRTGAAGPAGIVTIPAATPAARKP